MAEALFYHLERSTLEKTLPDLLARSLERGWRAVVKIGSEERLEALNAHLWTYDDASFLPHGSAADGSAQDQPIWLTNNDDNPNGSAVRFLADGASCDDFSGYERTVWIFDGTDEESVQRARAAWKAVKAAGLEAAYWRQDERGGWKQQA